MSLFIKKIIRITAVSVAAAAVFAVYTPFTVCAEPSVNATSAVVMNAQTGELLYEKNCDEKCSPSGLAKIMTAILADEYGKYNDTVTMSYNAVWGFDRSQSHIALDVDEQISFEQLMYGMLLVSANDCSIAIAETVSQSVDSFCEAMNAKAKELGAVNTNFSNPHGIYDENTYSTARDIGIITCEALKREKIAEIMGTLQYSIPPTNKQKETRVFNNSHKMLPGREYHYPEVASGKTGYISDKGYDLVTYAESGGIELLVVILEAPSEKGIYKDTANLLDYFFSNYELTTFRASDCIEDGIDSVELANAGKVEVSCDGTIKVLTEKGVELKNVTATIIPDNELELPITEGTKVGIVSFNAGGRHLGDIPIYAKKTMYVRSDEEISDNVPEKEKNIPIIARKDTSTFGKFMIVFGYVLLVLFIIFVIVVIIALCIRQQNLRKMQRRRMTRKRSGSLPEKAKPKTPYDVNK